MNALTEINSFSYSVLILLLVILLKALVTHFIQHEPLRFFQFYCLQLASKVNKPENSAEQQIIAGSVAIIVTLTPTVVILWLFEVFVEVDYLWQGLLLYFSISSFGIKQVNKSIAQAIVAKQNYLAKQTLSSWVLRDTEQLSGLGMSKAVIEMQLLRTLQQAYVVAIIFILFGPLATASYRLLLEMHYSWNTKIEKFQSFGKPASQLINLFQWLPVRVFSLLLLFLTIGRNFSLFWRLSKKYFFQLNNNYVISLLALSLEVKLGGIAMYQKSKLGRVSFNDLAKQPQATDIIHANKQIKRVIWLSLFFVSFLALILAFAS